jgi:hypothetical protein
MKEMHKEKLHNLYSLTGIIGLIESESMKWVGHVAHMEQTCVQNFCWKI